MSGIRVGQPRNARGMLPTPPSGQPVASYSTYEAAQRAVDHLSDAQFPVEHLTVVGEDLQLVERVTGRLTYTTAAVAGAGSGAWLGLFFGVLISFVARDAGYHVVLVAVLLGAAFGILLGIGSFAISAGRRDFSSFTQIVARRYVVLCSGGGHTERAYWTLQRLADNPQLPDGARPIGIADVPPAFDDPDLGQPDPSDPARDGTGSDRRRR